MKKPKKIIKKVRKRNGRIEPFNPGKIFLAIKKALKETKEKKPKKIDPLSEKLTHKVIKKLEKNFKRKIPGVEEIQDIVEETLIKNNLSKTAKAFILYRQDRTKKRKIKTFFGVKDDLKLGINAIKVLQKRYLLRDRNGKIKETPSQLFKRVAKTISKKDKKLADIFYKMMVNQEFLPNSPCLMNAGARLGQLSACFTVGVEDSLDSIFDALKITAKIHQSGGGTGFSFSEIRPKGALIKSTSGKASGPISFMKIFDKATEIMKEGGLRRGANMGTLDIDHPDIKEFITIKSNPGALKNFNLSTAVTDKFMKEAVNNKNKKISELFNLIITYAWQTGDPGMIFLDEINRKNPTRHIGKIKTTNPCGETPLHPWESCNLGSVNLTKFIEGKPMKGEINWNKLRKTIHYAVRFLDNMIDINKFPNNKIKNSTKANRRIGLGVMGLAEALILLGIPYNSEKAIKTAEKIAKFIEEESVKMSVKLGKTRGSFPNFKGSLWDKKGFKHMRNATTTVIAPTGTISIIAGCSSGIEPLFAVSFIRNVMENTSLIESNRIFEKIAKEKEFFSTDLLMEIAKTGSVKNINNIPPKIKRLFITSLEIPVEWHVKMQAAFQKHTHSAVSKTINLPKDAAINDVKKAYLLAWKLKCKGITVYRYGSKPDQVLKVGSLHPESESPHVTAGPEFAGGCPANICSEPAA
ncbi:adenosylcobalamin-dependent ribonucleoside-diphosphate reductase [Candidatus Peregrinibacteria bacterium]|nr:adenosylcobalamin-dependent ribonucleoside-diphosphate reductase [Candidatus Peregrinibacteria bacterium]